VQVKGKQQSGTNIIKFKDVDQRNRYKTLVSKTIFACRYPDSGAMNTIGIRDNVVRLLNNLGMSCLCCGLCRIINL